MKLPKLNLSKVAKNMQHTLGKYSPQILTGIGVAGMITTVVLAVKATPKALELIEDKKEELDAGELTVVDTVKVAWKPYIPAVVTGVLSTVCIIGGNAVGTRRTAALAAAYKISETALHEYKDAIVETVGEEKAKEVKEKIAQNKLDKNPVVEKQIIVTNKGTFLCYDSLSGRYFQSDIETIRKAQNDINDYLFSEDYASLNMFYDFLGLEHTRLGAELGWKIDSGTLQIEFDSTLASDKSQGIAPGTPCLVLDYNVAPKYEFDKMSY